MHDVPEKLQNLGKDKLIENRLYDTGISKGLAGFLGSVGLAMPVQAVHDAFWKERDGENLAALKVYEAMFEAAPQMYVQVTGLIYGALRGSPLKSVKVASVGISLFTGVRPSTLVGTGCAARHDITLHSTRT